MLTIALAFIAFAGRNYFFISISRMIKDDRMIFEMSGEFDGKAIKMMEITYTR